MYTTKQTRQSGSVAIFLVVSVVLAALVIGGIYAVQDRGANVRTNEPIAQQKNTQEESKPQTDSNQQAADDKAKKEAEEQKKQADEQKKNDAAKQAAADKAAREKAEAEKQQQAAAQQSTIPQTSTAPQASTLPATGPKDSFLQIIAGAVLTAILIAYLKSYRHRFGSLRR